LKLPGADRAVIDDATFVEYCLNPYNPVGRHKARVFLTALGISASNYAILRDALSDAANHLDASPGRLDQYGQRYQIDARVHGPTGTAIVRSAWIVRTGEDFPRLVTCYVLE
jgi:hypothetical protein